MRGVARALWAEGGAGAFWRGNLAGMGLYSSYMAVQFPLFEAVQGGMRGMLWGGKSPRDKGGRALGDAGVDTIAGAAASAGATVATYPFDWARTLLAGQQGSLRYTSGLSAAWDVCVAQGKPQLMWRGAGVAAVAVAP